MNTAIQKQWNAIMAMRNRPDEIEAMDPIPADYADAKWWPR